jgi:N-acyl-D-amino-acid deacylase
MCHLTREWMEAGAAALCVGLDYQPGGLADTAELIALARVVAEYGGVYAAHIRYGELGLEAAWCETMRIAEEAGVAAHISHEWVTDVTEELLAGFAARGQLTFDSYLYPAGCTHLAQLLPPAIQAGGLAEQRRRLQDPEIRREAARHLQALLDERKEAGGSAVFVATQTGRFLGMDIVDAAGTMPVGEFAVAVLMEEDPYALMVFHRGGSPADHAALIRRTVSHPNMLVASDGIYHGPLGHPRAHGCFPRVLRLCVREMQAITLEQAIYRMSGCPAQVFGLVDRGCIRTGGAADLVIFDPDTAADSATWEEPQLKPAGIDYVLVNGQIAACAGRPTGVLAGRVLKARAKG